jgi:Predicted transcriptional regulators
MNLTFGEKLKTLRNGKHLTQTQLANIFGLSLRTIQSYEKGRSFPKQTELYGQLADFFGVTVEYLMSECNNSKDIMTLIAEIGEVFASDELSDEDKDTIIKMIYNLYRTSTRKRK